MGDNIHLGDRDGVRTPMQWSPDRNGGFSRADPARLSCRRSWTRSTATRRSTSRRRQRDAAFAAQLDAAHARGARASTRRSAAARLRFLYPRNRKVLAYLRELRRTRRSCASPTCRAPPQAVELDLSAVRRPRAGRADRRRAVPADRRAPLPADAAALRLLLVPAGERGAQRRPGTRRRRSRCPSSSRSCCATASTRRCSRSGRADLEREALPAYLPKRRWFAAKDEQLQVVRHRLCGAAAGTRPRRAAGRDRGQRRTAHRALRPAARDRSGRTRPVGAAAAAARAGRACGAAAASAC